MAQVRNREKKKWIDVDRESSQEARDCGSENGKRKTENEGFITAPIGSSQRLSTQQEAIDCVAARPHILPQDSYVLENANGLEQHDEKMRENGSSTRPDPSHIE